MSREISLSPSTFARLQQAAEPLVDTIDTVINRALDALESTVTGRSPAEKSTARDPATPPSLSFTTVRSVTLGGRRFPPKDTYWNSLLNACICEAAKMGKSPDEIKDLILVPCVLGRKEESGFKFIEEAGISVQGQDANAAWKAIFYIANNLGLAVEVSFVWQANPKAAFPGDLGTLSTMERIPNRSFSQGNLY